ncbi:MAG: HPr family phosphocarrier protein, partial [Planctomycetia bacterium]
MEASRDVRIVNPSGLHARPSHAIVKLALAHRSELTVRCGELAVNGRSILDLMTLGAPCDAFLSLH